MNWRDYAACIGVPTEFYFIEKQGSDGGSETAMAKRICSTCPVRRQCLDAALYAERNVGPRLRFGIRGGLPPRKRAELWSRLQKQRTGKRCTLDRHPMLGGNVLKLGNGMETCRACQQERGAI